MPSFNLVGLDTVVNLTENVEYPEYVPPDISASYYMHLYEAPELLNDIFHFKTTDPELTTSTADNDMAFKCEPTNWPDLPFSEGIIRNDVKQDIKTYSVPAGYYDRITKNIGVQWLAKNITGGYNNSDIFANESELQTQYKTLDISKPNDFGSHPPFKYYRLAIDITQPTMPENPTGNQLGYMQIFRILAYDETGYLPVVSSSVSRFWGGANGTNVLSNLFQGEEIDFNGGTDYSGVGRMGADFGWTQFFSYSGGGEFLTNGLGGEYVEWEYDIPKKLTELRMLLGGVWGWSTRVILFGTNDATIASGNENWTQLGNPWNSGDGGIVWGSFNISSKIKYQLGTFGGGIAENLKYKLSLGGSNSAPLSNADTSKENISRQIFNALIGKTNDNAYRKGRSIEQTRQRVNDMIVSQQSNQRYIITNYDGSYNSTTNKLVDKKGTNNAILPDGVSLPVNNYNNPELNNRYHSEWGNYIHFDGSTTFDQTENYAADLDHNNYSISMVIRPTGDTENQRIFDNSSFSLGYSNIMLSTSNTINRQIITTATDGTQPELVPNVINDVNNTTNNESITLTYLDSSVSASAPFIRYEIKLLDISVLNFTVYDLSNVNIYSLNSFQNDGAIETITPLPVGHPYDVVLTKNGTGGFWDIVYARLSIQNHKIIIELKGYTANRVDNSTGEGGDDWRAKEINHLASSSTILTSTHVDEDDGTTYTYSNQESIDYAIRNFSLDLSYNYVESNTMLLEKDTWNNINLTVNNQELKVYNGVTESTYLRQSGFNPSLTNPFVIGASTTNANNFIGDLASFLVLNKACTPQELVNLQRELYPNAMNPPNQYVEEKWTALKFKENDVMEFGLRYLIDGISQSGYAKDTAGNLLGTNKLEDQNYVCRINMKYSKVRWVASHIYNNIQSADFSDKTTANILNNKFMIYGNPFPLNNDNNIELTIDCSSYTGGLQYVGLILIESSDASFNVSNPFNGSSGDDWVDMVTNGPSIGLYNSEYLETLTQGIGTRIFKWNASEKILYIWDGTDATITPTKIRGINPEKYNYAVPCVMKRDTDASSGTIKISSTTPYFLRDIPGQGASNFWYYNPYHLNYEDMTSDPTYTWIEST
jgi:hypothetical protein